MLKRTYQELQYLVTATEHLLLDLKSCNCIFMLVTQAESFCVCVSCVGCFMCSEAGFCGQLEVLFFTYLQLIYDQASA